MVRPVCQRLHRHCEERKPREFRIQGHCVRISLRELFPNGAWKFEKKDGKKYVVFSGNFSYMMHPVEAEVYFVFANDEKHFSLSEIELNNVPQDDATAVELLNNVYKSY